MGRQFQPQIPYGRTVSGRLRYHPIRCGLRLNFRTETGLPSARQYSAWWRRFPVVLFPGQASACGGNIRVSDTPTDRRPGVIAVADHNIARRMTQTFRTDKNHGPRFQQPRHHHHHNLVPGAPVHVRHSRTRPPFSADCVHNGPVRHGLPHQLRVSVCQPFSGVGVSHFYRVMAGLQGTEAYLKRPPTTLNVGRSMLFIGGRSSMKVILRPFHTGIQRITGAETARTCHTPYAGGNIRIKRHAGSVPPNPSNRPAPVDRSTAPWRTVPFIHIRPPIRPPARNGAGQFIHRAPRRVIRVRRFKRPSHRPVYAGIRHSLRGPENTSAQW